VVAQALLSAISFHLLRVILAILLPIVRFALRHFRGLSKHTCWYTGSKAIFCR
jgi:hypothetical protein